MNVQEIIETPLTLDADSVWVPENARPFAYTDGIRSERYLESVFGEATDLSSGSPELEAKIVDWPSEYHLSPTRAQLLAPFAYDRSKRVLEVGCGCGAITRFLGETFDGVVSVEGSHARARLARMRTRDLDNVAIVQSPFEEVRFRTKFDIVFCIGVFEYASAFVEAEDPHERILDTFADLLAPDGVLVLAIENQLGLKYFTSSAEDHTGVMFEGIEGYPRFLDRARTFGYTELKERLSPRFPEIEYFFPLPDYKIPSCVISERMLSRVDASELIGSFRSVDHAARGRKPLFNEELAWPVIARNGLVPDFAHSFLVVAGKGAVSAVRADWLGVSYSRRRRSEFRTVTRFLEGESGAVRVVKARPAGGAEGLAGQLGHREWSGDWIDGPSLQLVSARRARASDVSLEEILEPSRVWFEELEGSSRKVGDTFVVDGNRIDSIWRNCFIRDGRCEFIDQEWIWDEPLPLNLVVARALYYFAQSLLDSTGLSPALKGMTISRFITAAADSYGLSVTPADLDELVRFESGFLDRSSRRPERMQGARGRLDVQLVLRRKLDPARRRSGGLVGRVLRRLRRTVLGWRSAHRRRLG